MAAGFGAPLAAAQVQVNAGETLTEDDLIAGKFSGAAGSFGFTLSPSTVFEINNGGEIGPIPASGTAEGLDFRGATINLNNGGRFASPDFSTSRLFDVTLNLLAGGLAGGTIASETRVTEGRVNITGGTVGDIDDSDIGVQFSTLTAVQTSVMMTDGLFVSR